MPSSDVLFSLIRSLSPAEKKYFRTHAAGIGGKDKNYLHLFNYLDKQKTYDETALRKHFKGERFLKQLHVTKNYLYNLLIKHLASYHMEGSRIGVVRDYQDEARVLFDKGFIPQAKIAVEKSLKSSQENDYHVGVLIAKIWNLRIAMREAMNTEPKHSTIELCNNIVSTLREMEGFYLIVGFCEELFGLFLYRGASREPKERNRIISYFSELKQRINFQPKGVDARLRLISMCLYYSSYINDLDSALYYANEEIKYFRKSEAVALYTAQGILACLNHFYVTQRYKGILNLAKAQREISAVPTEKIQDETVKFSMLAMLEIDWYCDKRDSMRAKERAEKSTKDLPKYQTYLSKAEQCHLYASFARAFIGVGEFEKALPWLNLIINDRKLLVTLDVVCYSHLLNIIVHLELGNKELIPSLIKSTEYYIEKQQMMYAFEKVVLRLIKVLINKKTRNDALVRDLAQKVIAFKQDSYHQFPFRYFDFDVWAERLLDNPSRYGRNNAKTR